MGSYVASVMAQRGRDAMELPGLSPRAWKTVEDVLRAQETPGRRWGPEDDRHTQEARRDALVAAAWERRRRAGAGEELDRSMTAARARLGEEELRRMA